MRNTAPVSWEDVRTCVQYMKDEHDVWCRVKMSTPAKGISPNAHLVVTVEIQYQVPGKNMGWELTRSATWPCYGHKTMPGLIMRLLYEAENLISKEPPKPRKMWTGTHFPRV